MQLFMAVHAHSITPTDKQPMEIGMFMITHNGDKRVIALKCMELFHRHSLEITIVKEFAKINDPVYRTKTFQKGRCVYTCSECGNHTCIGRHNEKYNCTRTGFTIYMLNTLILLCGSGFCRFPRTVKWPER